MKSLKISLILALCLCSARSFSQYDSVYAEISGDTVTLWQTASYRNCVSAFDMNVEQDEFNITWNQVYMNTQWVSCDCYFDLSVTFIVDAPGNYHADVYSYFNGYPEYPSYQGSVDFLVGNGDKRIPLVRSEIIAQYQSECYENVGLSDIRAEEDLIRFYPNPVRHGTVLNLAASDALKPVGLEIFTLTGERVFYKQYSGNQIIHDEFIIDDICPVAGIYLCRLITTDHIFVRKINVL